MRAAVPLLCRCVKPILLTAAIVYCAGLLLVFPIQIIATLVSVEAQLLVYKLDLT